MWSSVVDAERRRVASHLAGAEAWARGKHVSALDPLKRLVRALLLDELGRYRMRGRFPANRDFAERSPYFVDAQGTRCAMAHLLEIGGQGELVEKIRRQRNNARVAELADEPRLLAWLAAAGLSVAEAAVIQPAYCGPLAPCVCGNGWYHVPAAGVLDATLTDGDYPGFAARVDQIHGDGVGYQVGDQIDIGVILGVPTSGARVLVPVAEGFAPTEIYGLVGLRMGEAGGYSCDSLGHGHQSPPLTGEQLIAAVTASDCTATLVSFDETWGENLCEVSSEGCAAGAGSGSPTTLGILLAITAALVWRARR